MNLKRYCFIIIIILIFSINISAQNVEIDDDEYKNIQKFTAEIYDNYVNENFSYVYKNIYSGIKDEITEDEYVSYQEKNFEKYKLEIHDVDVGKVEKMEKLPAAFDEYIKNNSIKYFARVKVNYEMHFNHLEKDYQKKVNKKVYIGVGKNESKYLFWDPRTIKGD